MDPREGGSSQDAAEGAALDFSASTRSRRVHSTVKNSQLRASRCGYSRCMCCKGKCRYRRDNNNNNNNNNSGNNINGMGEKDAGGSRGSEGSGGEKRLNRGVADSHYEDDMVDYNCNYQHGDDRGNDQGHNSDKDGEGGRFIRRGSDAPKFVDLSTPTLIDEVDIYENEEEEREMVKLEYERIRRNASAPIGSHSNNAACADISQNTRSRFGAMGMNLNVNDGESVRRTPGAQMYRSNYDAGNQNQGSTMGSDSKSRSDRSDSFERESMRRTPGASKMHSSALATAASASPTKLPQDPNHASQGTDASGLGFGLTLTSPLATRDKRMNDNKRSSASPLGSEDPSTTTGGNNTEGGSLDSPWTGASDQKQQGRIENEGRNLYSPNTLRLTEDLGNLLQEDDENSDETQKISHFVFRSGTASTEDKDIPTGNEGTNGVIGERVRGRQHDSTTTTIAESWTTPFIVNVEQNQHLPSRVPRNAHRGRKSRLDRAGRSRGGIDRSGTSFSSFSGSSSASSWNRSGGNTFLPNAHQPTPLRSRTGSSSTYDSCPAELCFGSGIVGQGHSSFAEFTRQQQGHIEMNAPALNFGGAFSPPTRLASGTPAIAPQQQQPSLHPAPVTGAFFDSRGQGNSPFDASASYRPFPTASPAFGASFSDPSQVHQAPTPPPYFQGTPAFGHSSTFQTVVPHFGNTQHTHNPMFSMSTCNHPPPMSHSPTLNFHHHHNAAYQMNAPIAMHNPHGPSLTEDPIVNGSAQAPQQQPAHFVPSQQPWASNLSMQYEGMQPASNLDQQYSGHGSNPYSRHGGWQMQQFRMHHSPQILLEPAVVPNMVKPTPTWNSQEGEQNSAHGEGLQQAIGINSSAAQPRSSFASTVGRPPSRGKNQRRAKNPSRAQKWAAKTQQQKNDSAYDKGYQKTDTGSNGGGINQGNPSASTTGKKSVTNTKGGKKKHKDRSTPIHVERALSTPVEEIVTDNANVAPTAAPAEVAEDPADAKRAELTESPATRSAFKDFYRKLRSEERTSFQDAEKFAMLSLSDNSLPESIHWRVYLELADLAKRSNRFEEARKLYQQVYKLQPYASQGWLEFSKLEEECGNMNACAKILSAGLEYCEYSESLLTRAIKHEEKRRNLGRAREFLSRLKHVGIEKVWRTVLEGAMLEARAGNDVMARRVLKYLMHHVPWYGPLYLEAYKLEKDLGRSKEALAVVERGLAAIPRYGPLWFGAFRLCEELDLEEKSYCLPQSMAMIDRATLSISKELIWKVHLEAAQMLERSSTENLTSSTDPTFLQVMEMSRKRFALTIVSCPPNLRWKVWLAAGRMEVAAGNSDIARRLFLRAHRVVPDKGRAVALLECARLEEFVGDVELASAILCRSRNVGGSDWKVWLESVMLAIRNGNYPKAIALSQKALQQHSGTGRLWASLIQLRHLADAEEAQFESLALALNAVPKSGEVWCEGARIHLNPFSRTFDLQRASRHLYFATKFTPQYGDGFLETLRLLILDQLLVPISTQIWEESKGQIEKEEDEDWKKSLSKYIFEILLELNEIRNLVGDGKSGVQDSESRHLLLSKSSVDLVIERLHSGSSLDFIDISKLELRCANADPNYGPLWFHCRSGPTETARNVLARAVNFILDEIKTNAYLYLIAAIRRCAVVSRFEQNTKETVATETSSWEKVIDQELLSMPSLKEMIEMGIETVHNGVELLESSIPPTNFIAGIAELNQHHPIQKLSLPERRKMLFGADSLFS
eukprot:CAMPEP_0172359386 /NCGR_PEP_ID=MMETSP1060-20121228/3587_1 /TAXON_ID=37318 /ORGANISM="Pseudo-nitzschia pungens, Strain cf. cingulata" /LENGTH=1732 /DNA_ID=CAMNT_0013081015 /DNA_START=151 /DNA_END=5349 /DNA_ORIENTATION=+